MLKHLLLASTLAITAASGAMAQTAPKDVDLVFVIDRSGSLENEGATLSARIGEVMNGIGADSRIGSVQAGLVSYRVDPTLQASVTGDVGALQTAIDALTYSGATENGLGAMRSILPGGSLFGSIGWRQGTVRSIVLLTDEDSDFDKDYSAFGDLLDREGYLNNVIVSSLNSTCAEFGGTTNLGGCEYIPTSRPTGGNAAFDLNAFTQDTDTFITDFVNTKISEIVITDPTPTNPVPLPAAGWLMLAGLGGMAAMRRRKKQS